MAVDVIEEDVFLLRPDATSAAVHELAAREGWRLVAQTPRSRAVPASHQWKVDDGSVNLTEDHESGYRIVYVWDSPGLGGRLAGLLPLLDEQTVLDQTRAAEDPITRARLLRALVHFQVGAALRSGRAAPVDPDDPEHKLIPDDPRYLELFAAALGDPEPGIRRAAIDALGNSMFPGARAILRDRRDQLADHTEVIDFFLGQPPLRIAATKARSDSST